MFDFFKKKEKEVLARVFIARKLFDHIPELTS